MITKLIPSTNTGKYTSVQVAVFWVLTQCISFCGSFNDTVSSYNVFSVAVDHTVPNGRITDDLWIRKDLEGTGHDLIIKVLLIQHLHGGMEENHKQPVRVVRISIKIWTKNLPNKV
jgi:hypothetical protein